MGLVIRLPRSHDAPFIPEEFGGYLHWDWQLSRRLGGSLYHAFHEEELVTVLMTKVLPLRSDFSAELPVFGMWTTKGVWAGLNDYFGQWNHFGPFLLTWPVSVLDGRQFLVYRRPRGGNRSAVITLVEHNSPFPVYQGSKEAWKEVSPDQLFQPAANRLRPCGNDGYRVLLTTPLPMSGVLLRGVPHGLCEVEGCTGITEEQANVIIEQRLAALAEALLAVRLPWSGRA